MKLAVHLFEKCIKVGVNAGNKEAAVRAISQVARQHPQFKDVKEEVIFNGFMEREKVGTTGFGNSIAIPHFASEDISEFVVGIVTMPDGVDYDSVDGKPTKLFIFVIAPQSKRNQHLGILSSIARFFRDPQNVMSALSAASEKELYNIIQKQRIEAEEVKITYDYNLISVAIQVEEKFQDVLDIFTEEEGVNISVFEAENAGKFLYHMPLFASFWTSEERGFHRVVNATVKKTGTNQILQKLNILVDSLEGGRGIMISILDLIYKNGSLDI